MSQSLEAAIADQYDQIFTQIEYAENADDLEAVSKLIHFSESVWVLADFPEKVDNIKILFVEKLKELMSDPTKRSQRSKLSMLQ